MLYITSHSPVTPMSLGTNKALVLDINICPGQVNTVFGQAACLVQLYDPFSMRKTVIAVATRVLPCVHDADKSEAVFNRFKS